MRHREEKMARLLFILLAALWWFPAHAQHRELIGVWKLNSFIVESIQTKERKNVFGERPTGYLIITPERLITVVTAEGRKPAQTDEDRISGFRTLLAYTGLYRVEGDRLITKVDVAWNEAWRGTDQARLFRFEGGKLLLQTVPAPSATSPEMGIVQATLEWERSQ